MQKEKVERLLGRSVNHKKYGSVFVKEIISAEDEKIIGIIESSGEVKTFLLSSNHFDNLDENEKKTRIYKSNLADINKCYEYIENEPRKHKCQLYSVFMDWNNSPRRDITKLGIKPTIFLNANPSLFKNHLKKTDGVMIGRAAYHTPYLLADIEKEIFNNNNIPSRQDVIEKLAALVTAAFGLVAALAWNDAIKALFKGPCGTEGAGALCTLSSGGPWVYAIIVTVIAVFVTIWIANVAEKTKK